jgi:hypothetical protein
MKYIDPETARMGLFNDILTRKKAYPYEYKFSPEKGHIIETNGLTFTHLYEINPELSDWLNQNITGRYRILEDNEEVWGISFQKRHDAMLFKMSWL